MRERTYPWRSARPLLGALFAVLAVAILVAVSRSIPNEGEAASPGEADKPPGIATETPRTVPRITDDRPLVSEDPPFPLVETYLAINPTDPDNLLASAMATSTEHSVVYVSEDGGRTWGSVAGPDGAAFPGGDPMLSFDATGRAYFSTILPEIAVWRSEDGGRSWAGPVRIAEDRSADRQWVAGSREDGAAGLYMAAKTPAEDHPGDVLIFSRSRDGGASFVEPVLMPVDSGYLHTVTHLAVREDGAILMPFLVNYARIPGSEEVFRGRRWLLISETEGESWQGPFQVSENLQYGNANWDRAMKGLGGGGLAIDESHGPYHGTAYMTWAAVIDGYLQIVLAHSRDGGRSWSDPVRVNDAGFDADHGTPSVAVNGEGLVAVTWNDRRHDPAGASYRHFVALSTDGGRSFGPNRPVSDRTTSPGPGSRWLNGGDTQGLIALPDGSFRTVWTVGAGGDFRPWTAVIQPM